MDKYRTESSLRQQQNRIDNEASLYHRFEAKKIGGYYQRKGERNINMSLWFGMKTLRQQHQHGLNHCKAKICVGGDNLHGLALQI